MTIRTSLLAGAGLSALVLLGAASSAEAKPAKRHRPAAAAENGALRAEVNELRSEVAALTARLNAQDQAQHQAVDAAAQAQASAAAAQQQAQAAAAEAQAAQTQVAQAKAAVPAEVRTQIAAANKAPHWYDNTSVTGRAYFNVSHIDQRSDGATVGRSTAFDIKRLYVGIDHKFSDMFSASIVTDVSLIANTNTVAGTANSGTAQPGQGTAAPAAFPKTVGEALYLKNAYLQARLNPAFIVRFGAANLPWVPFVEDTYGFRYVENVLIDRTGFGTSADWGVHVLGTLARGLISYQVSAVDGAGYRNPLRSESIDLEGRVSLAYKGVVAAVGGYTGKRAADTFTPFSPVNNAVTPVQTGTNVVTLHTAERFDAFLAYTTANLRVGGEYFWSKNWNQVTKVPNDHSDGWSAWASYKVTPLFTLFGRYDRVRPTKDLFPAIRENYFNVGISYSPAKIVDLALVYKRDRVDHGFFAPTNANPSNFAFPIGGRNQGTYDEIGLFGQFRF